MPLPKGFIKNIKLNSPKVGPARRQEILDDIDNQGTFLPRGIYYEDMDKSFLDFANGDIKITIDGEKVPVIFLTIQRWAEFSKTWQHSDEFKDIKLPFITVVRQPDIQVGTNQAGNWNIPGHRSYTYVKVPTFENGREGIDTYKIPQPTSVDVNYEVRLFCNRMRDLNKLNDVIQKTFNARQHYVSVKGHPMPLHLETVGDESPIDDFENRRFYVQIFEILLKGYILNEDDFEVIPSVDRAVLFMESNGLTVRKRRGANISYSIIYNDLEINSFTLTAEYDVRLESINTMNNITSITILVGGNPTTLPLSLNGGDSVTFEIVRDDANLSSSFNLSGVKL